MAKNVKVVLNSSAVKELLRGSEMQSICTGLAENIAGSAQGEYEVESTTGANRCWATVTTHDSRTYHSNLKHNHLLKALK